MTERGVLETLAVVDSRDQYTADHSRRVRRLALAVGRELGVENDELSSLGHAALFHDIGKLSIPDEILLKPEPLTDEEWELMRSHSEEGARLAANVGFAGDTVRAIRHHHERFDGSGYPDGLAGEAIPLAARIIHLADAVDSMVTTRVYRPGRSARQTLAEVRRRSGTQFCPRCTTALLRLAARGSLEELGIPRRAAVAAVA